MADRTPQLENGYIRIATEWLEALVKAEYPGSVKDFVLVIARETWGWNETWREIPMRRLVELLGVSDTRIKKLRHDACVWCLVEWEPGVGPGSSGKYRVQKNYLDWVDRRVTGKWASRQTGNDGVPSSGNDGVPGIRGNDGVPPCGNDGVPTNRERRGSRHYIDSSIDTLKTNDSLESAGGREGETGDGFQDSHMALCNYPELSPALEAAQPRWTLAKRRGFVLDLIAAIEDPNTPVARQEVTEWLATDGMRPSYADRGDSYLRRMIAKREAAKRDGVPDARADPILAAHIAKEGPRPLDAMAAMIWDRKLEEARGEVRQTA